MFNIKSKFTKGYDNFCDYMQHDTKGVEIGIYTAAGVLFAVAYYKNRPITKFGKPSDIPNHFIRDRVRQYGRIKSVEPDLKMGSRLLVEHRPPIPLPIHRLLPISLPGISVNANGISWLQTIAVNRDIEFIAVDNSHKESANCQVFLKCPENKKALLDLSEALLGLGFAKIYNESHIYTDNKDLQKYFNHLKKIEKHAQNDRLGLWYSSLPPRPWTVRKTKDVLRAILLLLLPSNNHLRLPELVR